MISLREHESFLRVMTWTEWVNATRRTFPEYLVPWLVSNVVGLVLLAVANRAPKYARKIWGFLLAGPCCLANTYVSLNDPTGYHEYGVLAVPPMQRFIYSNYFSHPAWMVVPIALCQFLIGVELLFDESHMGRRKVALAGIITFFLGLTTLGVGSAFPSSLLYAMTMLRCWPAGDDKKSKAV